jgi:hypothetical protein
VLQVGDKAALDVPLQIGSSTEHVTVSGSVPLLRTEDVQQGLVIDNHRIENLPQYDRNPLAFAQLAPNVNGSSGQGGHGADFRINGGRTNETEYMLDGLPVTTGYLHDVPPSVPSKEGSPNSRFSPMACPPNMAACRVERSSCKQSRVRISSMEARTNSSRTIS